MDFVLDGVYLMAVYVVGMDTFGSERYVPVQVEKNIGVVDFGMLLKLPYSDLEFHLWFVGSGCLFGYWLLVVGCWLLVL